MKRSFTRKKKKSFFVPSVHVLSSLFFHLSSLCPPLVMFRCFVVLKSPKMEGKVTKGLGQSHSCTCCRQSFWRWSRRSCIFAIGQKKMLYHGNLAVCMLWGAWEGGILASKGLSKQDKKGVCFLTSPLCWTRGCAAVTVSPVCCFSTTCLVWCVNSD